MALPPEPLDQLLPATYRDARGTELIEIHNDGSELRTVIRGVSFVGADFDCLEADATRRRDAESLFTLVHGWLAGCELEVTMPVAVVVDGVRASTTLVARLELGQPNPERPGISRETLTLTLTVGERELRSSGKSGWFEDELVELWRKLEGGHLQACICCAFSDYSPYGHGLFGGLACFRGVKEAYRAVRSKDGLFRIWEQMSGFVQETYVCPEFELRRPGAGYRG